MKPVLALTLAAALPLGLASAAFAAGGDDSPPKTTKTAQECDDGQVWDEKSEACVTAESSLIDDDTRYDAVRELAYAGRIGAAQKVLATMTDQEDDRVLTYWGFTHRKLGETDRAMDFYRAALRRNPDNLLARSYMAQGFVAEGALDLARAELREIRARGGRNTWAEASLRLAIEGGRGFDY